MFPVLVIVTVCVADTVLWVTLPKATGLGAAVSVTTAATPVPERGRVAEALPLTFRVAVRAPAPAGLNVSVMVQVEPGASVPPFTQLPAPVLVTSAAFVPVIVKYGVFSIKFPVPVEETVTVWTLLVVPTT